MTGVAGAAALLLSVGLLCARRIDTAVRLCALQALSAAVALAETATAAAILAFACNGVALPLALARIAGAPALTWRGNAILSWSLAGGSGGRRPGLRRRRCGRARGGRRVGGDARPAADRSAAHTRWRRRSGCCRRRTAWFWWRPPSLG